MTVKRMFEEYPDEKKLTKAQIATLRRGVDKATKNAKNFWMANWCECGTVFCYGGFLTIDKYPSWAGKGQEHFYTQLAKKEKEFHRETFGEAEVILKLVNLPESAYHLFFVTDWPDKFRDQYHEAKTPRGRVAALKKCVEQYIKEHS